MRHRHGAQKAGDGMTKSERQYQARARDAGCLVCAKLGTPGTPASIHHVRKHGGLRALQEKNVIAMCPTHHVELHANRRNYEALYGFSELQLAQETQAAHGV